MLKVLMQNLLRMEAQGANLQLVQKTLQTHGSARKAIDELNKKN